MAKTRKCKYCDRQIHEFDLRCEKCNFIWNEGVKAGEESIRNDLNHIISDVRRILKC